MQLVVDKLLTNYQEIGEGNKLILFLHGWADEGKTFDNLAEQLTKKSKYKAIMVDLPGFGDTQAPAEAWGLDDYVEFVANFLDKIDQKPNLLVAHSNGGAIAIKGMANGQLEAAKLILLASAGIRKPSLKKTALRLMAKPAKLALDLAPKSTQRRLRQKLYSAIGSDYLVVPHMQETFKRVVSTDVVEDAKRLKLPTCLIYGEKDTATPPELGRQLAEAIPDSQYHEIPMAGHFVHKEQVYKVSSIIKDFIK